MDFAKYALRESRRLVDSQSPAHPNQWIHDALVEIIEILDKYTDSNFSRALVIEYLSRVAKFIPITPLTGEDDEWEELKNGYYVNKRAPSVLKKKDAAPYNTRAIVWKDVSNGAAKCFTGNIILRGGKEMSSALEIKKFPFVPKEFEVEVKLLNHGVYELVCPHQLEKALEHYGSCEVLEHDL